MSRHRVAILACLLLVAGACGSDGARLDAKTAGPAVDGTTASSMPSTSATPGARRVLLTELQGTVGPRGLEPAGGEIMCRGRAVVGIDMAPKPPFGRVSASFEIDMTSCPDGTVLTEIHVHDNVPGHSDRTYIGAAVVRSQPLIGGAGLVVATNDGLDPRVADELWAQPDRFILALHTERNPVGGAGRGVLRRG